MRQIRSSDCTAEARAQLVKADKPVPAGDLLVETEDVEQGEPVICTPMNEPTSVSRIVPRPPDILLPTLGQRIDLGLLSTGVCDRSPMPRRTRPGASVSSLANLDECSRLGYPQENARGLGSGDYI